MALDTTICTSVDMDMDKDHIVAAMPDNIPMSASERLLREKLGLGDLGVTLFVPIDEELFPIRHFEQREHLDDDDNKYEYDQSSNSSSRDDLLDDLPSLSETLSENGDVSCPLCDHDSIPVYIEPPDDPTELLYAPRILSEEMLQQIVNEALPFNLQLFTTWKRLFSINVHGDCLSTMLNQCKSFRYTLLIVKTSEGNIVGGFASEPWETAATVGKCAYYGRGASFVFSDFPEKPNQQLNFYKWVGANDYCQLLDVSAGRLALGGGGDFGLVIDHNFQKGSTGPCATFANPSLVPGIGGSFDVVEFEVYGIVPLMETIHFREQ